MSTTESEIPAMHTVDKNTTIIDILRERVASNGNDIAYEFLKDKDDLPVDDSTSYSELDEHARKLGAYLLTLVNPGDRIIMCYPPGLEFVRAFFACLYAGIVAVPVYPPKGTRRPGKILNLMVNCDAKLVVSSAKLLPLLKPILAQNPRNADITVIASDEIDLSPTVILQKSEAKPEDLAFLQYTSGSTGQPKGVMIKHKNIMANLRALHEATACNHTDVFVNWLPLFHDMGLICTVMFPIYIGARSILMSPIDFIKRPRMWLEAITKYKGTVSGGPNFSYAVCCASARGDKQEDLDLSSWRIAFNAAEMINAETLLAFAKIFRRSGFRQETFYPAYGMAEATVFVAGGSVVERPRIVPFNKAAMHIGQASKAVDDEGNKTLVACGIAQSGHTIRIVDPQTNLALNDNEIGEIWLSGPSLSSSYWGMHETNEQVFRAQIEDESFENHYVRSGDLGFIHNGQLFVSGRIKELVIVHGFNHYPTDLELTVQSSNKALRRHCGAAFSLEIEDREQLVIVQEVIRSALKNIDCDAVISDVRKALQQEHEICAHDVVLIKPGSLPKTSSGKIKRNEACSLYASGALEVINVEKKVLKHAPQPIAARNPLEKRLAEIVCEALELKNISMRDNFLELGANSLTLTRAGALINAEFNTELSTAEFLEQSSIEELAGLVGSLLWQRKSEESPTNDKSIERIERTDSMPLSYSQQRLWLLTQIEGTQATENVAFAVQLNGNLNVAALNNALSVVVDRHEILRTRIIENDGEGRQQICAETLTEHGVQSIESAQVAKICQAEASHEFNLSGESLFRFKLLKCDSENHVLMITMHHAISDGWSIGVLLEELGKFYNAQINNQVLNPEPLTIQYVDYAQWQRKRISGRRLESYLEFWKDYLDDAPSGVTLQFDRSRSVNTSFAGKIKRFTIDTELTQKLKTLSTANNATLYMTLLSAFNILLARYSGQTDIVVGTPVANRPHPELGDLIGFFVNTLVIRSELSQEVSFETQLAQCRENVLRVFQHQELPFERLVEEIKPTRTLGESPLFNVMFALQNMRLDPQKFDGLSASIIPVHQRRSKYDISLELYETANGLEGGFEYHTELFDASTIDRMASHFNNLLLQIVSRPTDPCKKLDMLDASERAILLQQWVGKETPLDQSLSLSKVFETQAFNTPGNMALTCGGTKCTYQQLNERANRLAHYLIERGVGPETLVAICLPRSEQLIVALLAVLKSGGMYLPLDPGYPQSRLAYMLKDSSASLVLTDSHCCLALPDMGQQTLLLDQNGLVEQLARRPNGNPDLQGLDLNATTAAYVIYTSGSTGKPKGICIEHGSVLALISWLNSVFTFEERARILCSTSVCFDLFVFEMWAALSCGSEMLLVDNVLALCENSDLQPTLINTVPSAADTLIENGYTFNNVQTVNLAGEVLSGKLVNRILATGVPCVNNLYGPSEDTTYSTWISYREPTTSSTTIGSAIDNTKTYVLDADLNPAPIGVVGELYLAGAGLARGYFKQRHLTDEKFIENPFVSGCEHRMYRTGDLVSWTVNGQLRFFGRSDDQVKVRGYRIELGEIEKALTALSQVSQVVVATREDEEKQPQLVAYLVVDALALSHPDTAEVATDDTQQLIKQMKDDLRLTLPDYMVPTQFVFMDALPVTPNGKVDRKNLPDIDPSYTTTTEFVAPTTATEKALCLLWEEILKREKVGVNDDFFNLGGHSLLATKLVSRMRRDLDIELPVRTLFESPSPAALAERIDSANVKENLQDTTVTEILERCVEFDVAVRFDGDQLRVRTGDKAIDPEFMQLLRTHKKQLIKALKNDVADGMTVPAIKRISRDQPLLASFAQQRIWFIDRLEGNSVQYNMPAAFRFRGTLNNDAFASTITSLIERHEILRTCYATEDGVAIQRIMPAGESVPLETFDLSTCTVADRDADVLRLAREHRTRVFDLNQDIPFHVRLLKFSEDDHIALFNVHHIASDGWSVGLLIREFNTLYQSHAGNQGTPLEDLPFQYADYAHWQREWLQGEVLERERNYWQQQLADIEAVHRVPLDKPRPLSQTFNGRYVEGVLDSSVTAELEQFCRAQGVTLFMFLQTVLAVVLGRYAHQKDVVLGTPVAGRTHTDVEALLGCFVNTLALRSQVDVDGSFVDQLQRNKKMILDAYEHQHVPFEMLVETLSPSRSLAYSPIFQMMLTLQNNEHQQLDLHGMSLKPCPQVYGDDVIIQLDLDLNVEQFSVQGLQFHWGYNTDLFEHRTVEHLNTLFVGLIKGVMANAEDTLTHLLEVDAPPAKAAFVRGVRIDVTELEQLLGNQSGVSEAVVQADTSEEMLVVVVACDGAKTESDALAQRCREALEAHTPALASLIRVEEVLALPRTVSGELDRQALCPLFEKTEVGYTAPRNAEEEALCTLWAEVLQLESVGIYDNFFELGGHSLLATMLTSLAQSRLQMDIPIRVLFEEATVAGVCEALSGSDHTEGLPPIVAGTRSPDGTVLSYAQQRLWFIDQLEGGSTQYNMPGAFKLSGALDVVAFERSLHSIIARHEVLRSRFETVGGDTRQVVHPAFEVPLEVVDLSALSAAAQQERLTKLAQEESQHRFDLSGDILLRIRLLRLSANDHAVLFNMHHIASDGWSMGVLIEEFNALYAAYSQGKENPLSPLEVQYSDYAQWQREWLQGEVLEKQLSYWREQLKELPQVHSLPLDAQRPAVQRFNGRTLTQTVDGSLVHEIETVCLQQDVTLFMFLQAAFATLLSRYSNETDIVMGSPIAGRTHTQVEPLIGFFVNTMVLRADLEGNPRFSDLLQAQKQTILDAYTHQHIPFEMLVETLQPERSLSHSPLFQVLLVLQNNLHGDLALDKTQLESLDLNSDSAKFDVTLDIERTDDGMTMNWQYNTDLFEAASIERMSANFAVLLRDIVAQPRTTVQSLKVITAQERAVLDGWNNTQAEYPKEQCLQQLFEAQAQATPTATAVVYEGQSLSYAELNERANQLAHYLIENGVGADTLVALCLQRSPGMIVALLGILKAGGAYVPLDPSYPEARLAYMLEDSAAPVLVSEQALTTRLPLSDQRVVCLDDEAMMAQLRACRTDNPVVAEQRSDHLAYVIYTSGSTGQPKGVCIEHRNVQALIAWANRSFSLEERAQVLCSTSICFDLFVFEMWSALSVGTQMLLVNDILDLVDNQQVQATLVNTVPSALSALLEQGHRFEGTQTINLAGEPLKAALVNRVFEHTDVRQVNNLYGPSEDTTYSTWSSFSQALTQEPSIGQGIDNTRLYVLDESLAVQPIGVAGELHIGGAGLSRGYWQQSGLTQAKFIENPFCSTPGEDRLYKTGDIVRWNQAGELEFIGRVDDQVKIRGFRIELGEIESQLQRQESVKDAVVVAREDGPSGSYLAAYVVPQDDAFVVESDSDGSVSDDAPNGDAPGDNAQTTMSGPLLARLRGHLRATLPSYMIPEAFVILPRLPLSPNGKVDRKRLPAPEFSVITEHRYVAPRTQTEIQLCELWRDALGAEKIGIYDDFFALGGHSLIAMRLVSSVREAFTKEIPLRAIFEESTVAGFAKVVDSQDSTSIRAPITVAPRDAGLPLSFGQQRLWFIDQLGGGSSIQYNMPGGVQINGHFSVRAFQTALAQIIQRHQVLHTVIEDSNYVTTQTVVDDYVLPFIYADLSSFSPERQEQLIRQTVNEDAEHPFNLSKDVLIRAQILRLSDDQHVALFNVHHIVCDGISIGLLVNELSALYEAAVTGKDNPLPPLPVQYSDFAYWEQTWLNGEVLDAQLAYWRKQLEGLPQVHSFPLDKARPAVLGYKGNNINQHVDNALLGKIRELCLTENVTLFMFLQTAFASLISRYSNETDIVMGTTMADRSEQSLDAVIGFFVNTLLLRSDLGGNPGFSQLLRRNKEMILNAFANQNVPFDTLVDELQQDRDLSHNSLFQIMLVLEKRENLDLELPNCTIGEVDMSNHNIKFDFDLHVYEYNDGLDFEWHYNTDLFEEGTIERLAKNFMVLMQSIVDAPHTEVAALPIMSADESQQVLQDWNNTQAEYPKEQCLQQLFEAQAQATPTATAVVYEGQSLSYAELNERANQLAHYLIDNGVGADTLVALCLQRSPGMIVALLGILKAGGAYVPLDPSYPEARLAYMLEDSAAPVLVSEQALTTRLPLSDQRVVCLDDEAMMAQLSACRTDNPVVAEQRSDHLAYVIYTSGSTGQPKGVCIEHRNVQALIAWANRSFSLEERAQVLCSTSICFDLFVFEMWSALSVGTQMLLVNDILDLVDNQQVQATLVNTVPSALSALLEQGHRFEGTQTINLAGEPLKAALVNRVFEHTDVRQVNNLYGPSEDTTYSTWSSFSQALTQEPSIGQGIDNTRLYVLDESLAVQPIGVAGELHIGGAGLSRGYWQQSGLTQAKFIENPFCSTPGEDRLYKTGDIVRWNQAGELEFIGRVDDQVKIRGFRIELGEIESQLQRQESVKDAVVVAREDGPSGSYLAAYVVPQDDAFVVESDSDGSVSDDAPNGDAPGDNAQTTMSGPLLARLRGHLRATLPSYMIPEAFVMMSGLPLSPNGKVDRKRLPAPQIAAVTGAEYVAPGNPIEQQLCDIWQVVLQLPKVGVHDNFFELGGNSLLAIRVTSAASTTFGVEIGVKDSFISATVASLANVIAEKQNLNSLVERVKQNSSARDESNELVL